MEMRGQPIGVFDSGVGGISVLRELIALMPNEDYIYFGDSRNAPYGTKTLSEVQRLACADAEYLLSKGVKTLVVACNTATSAAIQILRGRYPDMPVIGIEPALKPAVLSKKDPRVVVMATPMTLHEEKFRRLMLKFEERADIIPMPCPGLVEFVERGELSGERLEEYLCSLCSPYVKAPVDCAVLGCTHYPFVREAIQRAFGSRVAVFDGGKGTARETMRQLRSRGLLNPSPAPGKAVLENSLGSEGMKRLGEMLLKSPYPSPNPMDLRS